MLRAWVFSLSLLAVGVAVLVWPVPRSLAFSPYANEQLPSTTGEAATYVANAISYWSDGEITPFSNVCTQQDITEGGVTEHYFHCKFIDMFPSGQKRITYHVVRKR